jgi:dihydroorotase
MRRAVEYARMFGLTVMDHCQDYSLMGDGIMHEGEWSLRLGIPGWPRAGEEMGQFRTRISQRIAELA